MPLARHPWAGAGRTRATFLLPLLSMVLSLLTAFVWDVSNTAFTIGSWSVRWYGVLFALGFFVGQIILTRIYVAEGKPAQLVDVITFYMIVGTVVGARLGHCLFYRPEIYLAHPLEILKIWHGGLASHGATAGVFDRPLVFQPPRKALVSVGARPNRDCRWAGRRVHPLGQYDELQDHRSAD